MVVKGISIKIHKHYGPYIIRASTVHLHRHNENGACDDNRYFTDTHCGKFRTFHAL
jgi:hypothetical protein